MEGHERHKINTNLSRLIECTSCNIQFLATFQERNIFSKIDVETLKVVLRNEGPSAQAKGFYDMVQDRVGAYTILLEVLRETNQSGALQILENEEEETSGKRARTLSYVKPPKFLLDFLSPRNKTTTLVVGTDNCNVTCQRILETVQGIRLFKVTEFIAHISSNIYLSTRVNITPVINCDKDWKRIRNTLSFSQKKVFVANENDLDDIRVILLRLPNNSVSYVNDDLEWDDLSAYLQTKVEETLEQFHLPDECIAVLPDAKGKVLFDLIKGKSPTLFKTTLPKPLPYYVPRKLITRNVICKSVFSNEGPDIFLIEGVERHELSELANGKATDTSSNILHQNDTHVKLVLLEHNDHFDMIAKKVQPRPVHIISKQSGKFIWLRSSGGIHTIQKAVHNEQITVSEDNFLQNTIIISSYTIGKSLICVSATPGMGKSVLLAQFGRNLQQLQADGSVAFVQISELVENIKQFAVESDLGERVFFALARAICENELAVAFFRKNKSNLQNLLLDGLDELTFDDVQFGYKILTAIREQFPGTRVWVTTRPHMFDNLEKTFNVLGYNIEPFNEEDQVRFLDSYWSSALPDIVDTTKLPIFAKHCLNLLKSTMSADNEYAEDIAGVPLQCLLIAEVFEQDSRRYCATHNFQDSTINIKSLADLYEQLVMKKFNIFYQKYDKDDFNYAQLTQAHVYLSIMLLFPHYVKKLGSELRRPDMCLQQIFNVGILESRSVLPTPRFIHRTFAEFFVAKFMVESLASSMSRSRFDLLLQIFKTLTATVKINKVSLKSRQFKHSVICYFINSQLEPNRDYALSSDFTFKPSDLTNILTASVCSNFESIFLQLLCNNEQFKCNMANIITPELLMLCAATAGSSTVSKLFKSFTTVHVTPLTEIKLQDYTLVHIAVISGNYSAFEFLLGVEAFKCSIFSTNQKFENIVNCCVKNSKQKSEKVVNQKCEILKLLMKLDFNLSKLIEKLLTVNSTTVHVKLLVLFIQSEISVCDESIIEELLHKCTKKSKSSDYQQLIFSIKSLKGSEFIVRCLNTPSGDKSLLYKILNQMSCDASMLQFLKDNGLKFSSFEISEIKFWESVGKQKLECLEWLVNNCNTLKNNTSSCFWLCYDASNYSHCSFLLEKKLVDPISLKTCDKSIFHRLLKTIECVTLEICQITQYFVENQVDVETLEDDSDDILQLLFRTTPTLYAFQLLKTLRITWEDHVLVSEKSKWFIKLRGIGESEIHQYLSSFLKEIGIKSVVDNEGNTLLHLAAGRNNKAALKYFLNLGASVNTKNTTGETALHKLLSSYASDFPLEGWTFLIDHGADPTILDRENYTPICTDCDKLNSSAVQYAIKQFQSIDFPKTTSIFLLACNKLSFREIKDLCEWYTGNMKTPIKDIRGDFKGKPMTLLDVVLRRRNGEFLEYFIQELGCTEMTKSIDTLIYDGEFEFERYRENALKLVEIINKMYPGVFNRPNKYGFYPLSVKRIHEGYVQPLVSVGADVNRTDSDDNTPLHWALKHDEWKVKDQVKSLIDAGADVNAVTSHGETPLFLAINLSRSFNIKYIVKLLIDNKADATRKYTFGNTILHLLPLKLDKSSFLDIVEDLLRNGQSELLQIPDKNGLTPIQVAKQHFFIDSELSDLLLKHEISI